MKIAVDIRSITGGSMTGVGYYLYNSLENLIDLDPNIKWQLLSSGWQAVSYPDLNRVNVNFTHYKIPNKIINASASLSRGPALEDKLDQDVDLLWLPNINFISNNKRVPTALTIHDLSFLHSTSFYSWKRKIWHHLVGVKKLLEQAKIVIAVSENTKRDIIRFFSVAEEKIAVINPGITYHKLTDEEARKATNNLALPEKYFLYVGTLEPRKNLNGLIKAFDRLHQEYPQYQLVVVGGRGWLYSQLLEAMAKRPYIKYLGYQKGSVKDAIYKLAYAFVWPSFYEGFGFPPLEAMAQKKPVITSYKTSLPETLKNYALYVDPYNVNDIYMAMKNIIEDQHLHLSLISKSPELPNWDGQAKIMLDLFKKVIEHK